MDFRRYSILSTFCLFLLGVIFYYLLGNVYSDNQTLVRGISWSSYIHKPKTLSDGRYGQPVTGTNYVLIANNVPKTGSRVATSAIIDTVKRNHIKLPVLKVFHHQDDKNTTIGNVSRVKPPTYVHGHVLFYPYTNWEYPPIYINFVRDPIARMMSHYYFLKYGDNGPRRNNKETHLPEIESCIDNGILSDCVRFNTWRIQFCGYDTRCKDDISWAVEKAKENIDKYYTFIGISEEFETSLQILELLVPDLLGGLRSSYQKINENAKLSQQYKTKEHEKHELSPEMITKARELMKGEQEIYEFVYAKFNQLKSKYGFD